MLSVNDIRRTYIDYFADHGHEVVPSSSLVPQNDPTLMFTNAGMVQFKNLFTGVEKRSYTRAVSAQKCVRAGGKHNDLDNVGMTARHLTFFEMLGNFSFGDYFKEEAILMAWELITGPLGVDPARLLVTVYHEDDEAFDLWKKIAGFPDEKIIRIATDDNFWSMGDTGPCGPSSEIFYDYGPDIWGGPPGSAEEDGDRFIEIWNLVFTQYDQQADGSRLPLPRPCVDTGMGLERISALLQGTNNLFETDLFRTLVDGAAQVTGSSVGGNNLVSQRVIADHLRTMSFLIGEGVLPTNEGRGYVLRRIMRRAMRHATLLGAHEPVIHKMVPVLAAEMGQAYPELITGEAQISEAIRLEEERFLKTLDRGLHILNEETASLSEGDMLPGATAFKLYDTFGFPLDLTQDALRARGIGVDQAGFDAAMAEQKALARASWSGSGAAATEQVWFEIAESEGATEFLGYDSETAEGVVLALVRDGKQVDRLETGESGFAIFNQTPFYAMSGGQVGDTGIISGDGVMAEVTDVTKQVENVFAHAVTVKKGVLVKGQGLVLDVDHERRSRIRANHSATHLLHEALRQVLGPHVAQKGSLVGPESLRFDFSHNQPVKPDEMERVEALANRHVLENSEVTTTIMGVEEARAAGAMALFGEKYGDEVRVVSMGVAGPDAGNRHAWSMELCGGTHVRRTGDIGLVTIIQEGSVASGVRRIEALTREGARAYLKQRSGELDRLASSLKVTPRDAAERVRQLLEERRQLERQLSDLRRKIAMGEGQGGAETAETVAGVSFSGRVIAGLAPRELRGLVDNGKKQLGSGIVALVGVGDDGKAGLAVGVTDDLTDRFSAVELVRAGAVALGGKGGGGRPDMAQAGGPNGQDADQAIAAIRAAVAAG